MFISSFLVQHQTFATIAIQVKSLNVVITSYHYWFQENGRIMVKKLDLRRATLTINNLEPADTANYTCKCSNTGGVHALNSTITVHCE